MRMLTFNKEPLSLGLTAFNDLGAGPDGADEQKTRVEESGGEAAILAGARPAKLVSEANRFDSDRRRGAAGPQR